MPLIKPMNSAAAIILEKLFGKYQTSKQVKGEGFRLPLLKQGLTLAAGLSILMLIDLKPAHADLIICNQSGEKVYASVTYHKSSNDAWTSVGHYGINNNNCDDILSFDLNETVYFYAQASSTRRTHPSRNSTVTSFCIDRKHQYEVIWDGDDNIPYYKDLIYRSDRFRSCTDIHSDYEEVGFREISASSSYDHCTVALGRNGSSSSFCWD
ncbi:DUF1036 domain-containing protein [Candidatus Synechococcus spongiarum]|uniref:DUF1036 domain-containing protein n=1 Tax=Candidatus Synechococcus spongiarum TaxID=431041 RepID=UPI0013788EEE|nr:DUF1036 domain-containing protein [Candidatus Synechococcus spongiarum]